MSRTHAKPTKLSRQKTRSEVHDEWMRGRRSNHAYIQWLDRELTDTSSRLRATEQVVDAARELLAHTNPGVERPQPEHWAALSDAVRAVGGNTP